MKSDKNYEILSPAGSIEQLVAAVNNGCDSVYLGLEGFNARMKAPNFTADNLRQWVDFCHFFGVKVFVAVNTSIKNGEMRAAKEIILVAYNNLADGVIVTDLSLLKFAAELPKPFEIVASTQLNAYDGYGARFLKKMGADTVVCARECSFGQVQDIAAQGVKAECFIHGALCVCQSGQCLLSSLVGGNSGNRGLCAQPCRKLYHASSGRFSEKGGYLLSARDICGVETAKDLFEQGATVFKIEGRNRRAEYAGVTSDVYSRLFADDFRFDDKDKMLLAEVYNRGGLPSCAYLTGRNDGVIYPAVQNHCGVRVGKIKSNKVFAEVELRKGDGVKVFDGEKEVCGGVVTESGKGLLSAEFSARVCNGYTVNRTSSVSLSESVLARQRKRRVALKFVAKAGEPAVLRLDSDGVAVEVSSDFVVEKARTAPTKSEEIAQQLQKIGDLQYTITDIVTDIDEIFLPKSQINALRRLGFENLTKRIIEEYNGKFAERLRVSCSVEVDYKSDVNRKLEEKCLAVICRSVDELKKATKADILIFKPEFINAVTADKVDCFCYLDLPSNSDNYYLKQLLENRRLGIVCHNVGQVELAREIGLRYIAGTGLNIFNDEMASEFWDADAFFYSQELSLAEIAEFRNSGGLTFVDGKITVMKLVHCPYKLNFGCDCAACKAAEKLRYTDELGNDFVIERRQDKRCTFELVNGRKLSAVSKIKNGGRYCVDFDEAVIKHYANLNSGVLDDYCEALPYTKGRLYSKIN